MKNKILLLLSNLISPIICIFLLASCSEPCSHEWIESDEIRTANISIAFISQEARTNNFGGVSGYDFYLNYQFEGESRFRRHDIEFINISSSNSFQNYLSESYHIRTCSKCGSSYSDMTGQTYFINPEIFSNIKLAFK